MKKILCCLLFGLLLAAGCGKRLPTSVQQQPGSVARRVVMELFTATWCSNCPVADQELERLFGEMGDSLTVIEYHPLTGSPQDPLASSQTQERGSFYGVDAWPTLWCDGSSSQVGTTQDTYQSYSAMARIRVLLNSPVKMDISGRINDGLLNYSVTIYPRSSIDKSDLRLLVLALEDSVYYSAPNQTNIHRFVCRRIEPGTQGLPISLTTGIIQVKQGTIVLDTAGWRSDRLWLAAFVQSFSDKEILQSCLLNLSLPVWDFTVNSPDTIASVAADSVSSFQMALKNTGNQPDTFWVDLPDSLVQPPGINRTVKDVNGVTIPLPAGFLVNPGDSVRFTVNLSGSIVGDYAIGLRAWPGRAPNLIKGFNLHLNIVAATVFDYTVTATDTIKIASIGEVAEFPVLIKNTGNQEDSIYLDLPDSLAIPSGLARSLCDVGGFCYPLPLARYIAPGDSISNLVVHLQSSSGGSCECALTLRSKGAPGLVKKLRLLLEVVK